ncbi:MAG: hypothetical protein JW844_04465 [Candidatus Omnitrophica bacterium]|nr:hypothetical protein [Candidatus Omnitrophota bacterium]
MRRSISFFIAAAIVCEAGLVWAHSEEAAVCVKTYNLIKIDAELADWTTRIDPENWGALLKLKKGEVEDWMMMAPPSYVNKLTSRVEAGEVSTPKDFSMTFYCMWDEENFYFAAEVTDDAVVAQHEGDDIWQDDCIEVWFDGRYDAVTKTMFQDDEYQIGFSPRSKDRPKTIGWCWRNPNPQPVISNMKVASRLTETGYILEVAIPFSALRGITPEVCKVMGFNVSVVDKDQDQLWTHITWSGYLHSNPTQFGKLYFVDAPIEVNISDLKKLQK